MFGKTKIALSAAMVLSTAFPASAATKHHRVTHVHPAIYNTAPAARSDDIPTLDVNPVCHGIAMQGELEAGLQKTSLGENRVTPNSSPVWKWRAMYENYTKMLTPCPSRTYRPHRWVIASRRRNSV